MKIVILDGYALNPGDLDWHGFEALGHVELYDRTPEELIASRIEGAEIVITNKTPLNRDIIEGSNIKYIGVLATGYNVVDIQAASENGITVTNVPSYGTQTVAQHTISLLLEICQNVGLYDHAVKSGKWHESKDFCFFEKPIIELADKTMGIIGLGKIGQCVYRLAEAFGMKVIAYNRSIKEGFNCVSIDQVLSQSDVISLHCPLTEETNQLINEKSIEKMKDGVIILNTSRGGLINEADLYQYLKSNKIYAAAIDVLEVEPPRHHHPIMDLDNVIITPHIAWASKEARIRLMDTAVDNLNFYLNGQIKNQVN
ncbi:D-2-hydroxyacid dehydrogenase [Acidaminobacter sp. JC074]|uniref:D-2-hydroxyacid dehydrogenase n=1 Tax=Acidaminobacter sp. JC074 TaxID=2530199 RepID=UPI001F0FA2D1|nr:D-2-hydroxyacid dehydrogenase [Acidaminobacter sp. JC074]MCH4891344.1 D-2-hydroxyacid dehydrogenase [Acidaminobacter sp. JC074]